MNGSCDIIVFGGGVAGLWTARRLVRAGYNVVLFEKDALGGMQTLASQGMIHGGQKYTLEGDVTGHAASIAKMPERWEACFGGWGEIDLTAVRFLSETQLMWPAGSIVSDAAVFAASKLVNSGTRKLAKRDFPAVFQDMKKFRGAIYEMPEKVVEIGSLVRALAAPLQGRVFRGEARELLPDGQVVVGGRALRAQAVVFAAGAGNERALDLLGVREKLTQRRPLRQVMVRRMPDALFGHGIVGSPKPRVTVTSHLLPAGDYLWYLGGNVAETGAALDDSAAIAFAKKEMEEIFPQIDWNGKEWATWAGDRAEPYDAAGHLPPGPVVHQRGQVLLAWPAKLTFAPALADRVLQWLKDRAIAPANKGEVSGFSPVDMGRCPWETAVWRKAGP